MRTLFVTSLFLCTLSLFVPAIFSAGFSIYEQGATAMGMAGAFTAKADNPSAIFYNPAGISQLEDTQIAVGMTAIPPKSKMEDPYGRTWETEDQVFWIPNVYLTHHLNDDWNLGLGIFAPYGLGMDWSGEKYFVYRYLLRDVSIESIYVSPVVSYRFLDDWSVAAGALWVKSKVSYKAAIDMTNVADALSAALGTTIILDDSDMTLKGDNDSGDWGFNLGVHGQIDRVHLGLSYRSKVKCGYEGNANFYVPESGYGPAVDSIIRNYFPDTKGRTEMTMPETIAVGLGYDVTEKFYTEFDVLWMGWSSYKSLDIDFEFAGLPDVSQKKDWKDVLSYRLGLHYQATDQISVFGGVYYDTSPVPDETLDPILPDADRYSMQIGAGYDFGNLNLRGSYMYLQFKDRETTTNYRSINGAYESNAHMFSVQATYKF
ncbi:MAG: OmpP1/FadL family transporter [bacterium]